MNKEREGRKGIARPGKGGLRIGWWRMRAYGKKDCEAYRVVVLIVLSFHAFPFGTDSGRYYVHGNKVSIMREKLRRAENSTNKKVDVLTYLVGHQRL